MDSWRAKVSGFFRRWQQARDAAKRVNDERRDQRAAEELDRAREGVQRFPPMGG